MTHPFWQGELQHLTKDLETSTDMRQSVQQSIANFSARASVMSQSELPKGNSVLGQIHAVNIGDVTERQREEIGAGDADVSLIGTDRPGEGNLLTGRLRDYGMGKSLTYYQQGIIRYVETDFDTHFITCQL